MLCDECGINPATIRFQTIAQGKKTEENLCRSCWEKKNKDLLGGLSLGDLIAGLVKDAHQLQEPDLVCDTCGQTYAQFKKTGLLGCAACYSAFGESMEKALLRVHGRAQHAGKVPPGLRESLALQKRLQELKAQMDKAVAMEDFESAARLRDEMRLLSKPKDEGVQADA